MLRATACMGGCPFVRVVMRIQAGITQSCLHVLCDYRLHSRSTATTTERSSGV